MSANSSKSFNINGLAAAFALLLVLACGAGVGVAFSQASDGSASAGPNPDEAALLARGKYLTAAADCMPCHTGPGRAPFSGGLVLNTPFGGLASSNITPDKEAGIGNWTPTQFWNAVHEGIAPGRAYGIFPRYLYPAMPFTSYNMLSYQDVMAIRAYLMSLAPVKAAPVPNTLGFPFNQRPVLLGWRILFFHPRPLQMKPEWSPEVKQGAYLTEALGHCGECHTPRNAMGAMILSRSLAGGSVDAFYAPNISSDKTQGIGGWSPDDLVAYLHADGNMTKGSAYGPMAEVVQNSLSQLPQADVQDIASYLQTAVPPRTTPMVEPAPGAEAQAAEIGAKTYAANCASCHGQDGKGRAPSIPPLAGNSSVTATGPQNIIGAVLSGLPPWNNGPAMPSFATALSDPEIAAVANYVRISWGNSASANATPKDVLKARALAIVPPLGGAMADAFGCPHVSGSGGNSALADPGNDLLQTMAGATPQTLPNRTRMLVAALRANDSAITDAQLTNYLIAAYCPVIADRPGLSRVEKEAALRNFIASAQTLLSAPALKPGG